MTLPVHLRLAGHAFRFTPGPGAPAPRFPPAYGEFLAKDAASPIATYTTLPPDAGLPSLIESEIIWQTETWCLSRPAAGGYAMALHVIPDERRLTVARFSDDFSLGELRLRAGRKGAATPYAFNYPVDQVAVMNRLTHAGAGVVHASAVLVDGEAVLFSGRSGAGKTTLARLFRDAGHLLLNDDRQFLWMDRGRAFLAPTPWHGSDPEVHHRVAPLRAMFHLVQAPHNRITPVHGAVAAAKLLGNTVAPFYFGDALARILALWEEMTDAVPSYTLEFAPTPDAVACVRRHLGRA